MSTFAIAGVQLPLANEDNLSLLGHEVAVTKQRFPWVDMIVFGELAVYGPRPRTAEPLPGPAEAHFQALARKHRVWLVPGSMYELDAGKVYNTAPVIDPRGEVQGRYRKIYPFTPYEQGVSAGNDYLVFEVPGVGRFGLSICYDMWFPETTRTLAWMGAEVIIHPTLTGTLDRDVELAIARANAAINQVYLFDINSTGRIGNGRSIVVGPDGDVLHQAGTGLEYMPLEIDLQRVRRARERGLKGLGQPLKSFRDGPDGFPCYGTRSAYLDQLGPLQMPAPATGRLDDAA